MSRFTYEREDRKEKLEIYEWDNVWIDHAENPEACRVLYIGDSISCGTRNIATELSNEKILFDGFGTSKGLDNPYFVDSVKLFAAQEVRRNAVIFNNGLHGFHMDDDTEYAYHYEQFVKFLLNEFAGTPVAVVLTTHVTCEERNKRVIKRNDAAAKIAEKYSLPVIDLYKVSFDNKNLLSEDGVHFVKEGYELLAKEIIASLEKIL